ncbi:MAG: superoxide dismutase [Patescibacteria group bacterium]
MQHEVKDFSHLKGTLKGFSDAQLDAHFGLYAGYVKKLNEIEEKLKTIDRSLANYTFGEYSELKRREAVAFNGSYLHELYFENLSGEGGEPSAELKAALEKAFGSMEAWETDIKASGGSTPGWVLLTWNHRDQSLHHYIMFEHHIGLPVHQTPVLALDCWEHAFMIDYGTKKPDYLAAFLQNVNWKIVNERFAKIAS